MSNSTTPLYKRLGGHDGILKLIKTFYVDARQHAVLGPIFNARIQDWPAHLDKITDFWALQTGGPTRYRGGFAGAHLPLGLLAKHFQQWLGLWEWNNARHLAPFEAAEMNELARELGRRLFAMTQKLRPSAQPTALSVAPKNSAGPEKRSVTRPPDTSR